MSKSGQLMEYIIRDIIEFHSMEYGLDVKESMSRFYNSEIFNKLNETETGLYLCGSAYVYELFLDELRNGKIVQHEI
jgi:hypothetical protein